GTDRHPPASRTRTRDPTLAHPLLQPGFGWTPGRLAGHTPLWCTAPTAKCSVETPSRPFSGPGGVKAPSGAAGALPPTGRAASVLRLRRLAPGVRFRNGAVVGLCRVLESGGGIVSSLRRGPWTGASTPQPAQQITESH